MDYQTESKDLYNRVLSIAKRIICKHIPKGIKFELYLIGSAAREEMTILLNSNEKLILSDMEFYIITDMKQMIPFIDLLNKKLSRIKVISVEINGTNYQKHISTVTDFSNPL